MTSTVAAGNGSLSHGLYRGLAPEADLVLVRVRDSPGKITNESIERGLRWLLHEASPLKVCVVSLSVAGEAVEPLAGNAVDAAVEALVAAGMCVIAAAGNDGVRRLAPPATSPDGLTVGGLDDQNTLDHDQRALWHSNYGQAATGALKPDVVAPSLWVVAPILPGSDLAREAAPLFERRGEGDPEVENRIGETKLLNPHYQHVEGTSFAAPLVAATVACMLEANPDLKPRDVRNILCAPAPLASIASPRVEGEEIVFTFPDRNAGRVAVSRSWDEWVERTPLRSDGVGRFSVRLPLKTPGRHAYKFLVEDGATERWVADPSNPTRVHDRYGGYNSALEIRDPAVNRRETPGPG